MQIEFLNVRDAREQPKKLKLTFLEAEKVRGDLQIHFHGAQPETYQHSDVSVPLTVAEAKLFLARVKSHGHATWRLFFSPFLDGKLEDGFLRLMEGSRDHLSGTTVEVLSPEALDELEAELDKLERQHGRLPPTEDAVDSSNLGGG